MPNETKNYGTVITTAGAALIAKCILNGGKVNIKTAAAGDGGGEYYEPTVAQTALRGKKWEGDVASAAVSTTNANMIDVKITIDDSVGGFTIREMGLFDDDGTLIAICNTPDTEKVSTDGGVSGKLTMIMHIVVADASVVSFTITPGPGHREPGGDGERPGRAQHQRHQPLRHPGAGAQCCAAGRCLHQAGGQRFGRGRCE